MSDIEDFIHAVDSGSNVEARNVFNTMMQDKLSAALDAKRAEIADRVYNAAETEQVEPEEEFTDVDIQGTEIESD